MKLLSVHCCGAQSKSIIRAAAFPFTAGTFKYIGTINHKWLSTELPARKSKKKTPLSSVWMSCCALQESVQKCIKSRTFCPQPCCHVSLCPQSNSVYGLAQICARHKQPCRFGFPNHASVKGFLLWISLIVPVILSPRTKAPGSQTEGRCLGGKVIGETASPH